MANHAAVLSQITIEKSLFLFKRVIMPDDVKEHKCENIVTIIDGGMFHNYIHVRKQLFSFYVIGIL